MRFAEPVRMADDGASTPVWARPKRRRARGGGPLIGFLITLLAIFGALTAVLGVKERSLAEGGAVIDGWIAAGWSTIREATGQTSAAASAAAEETTELLKSR